MGSLAWSEELSAQIAEATAAANLRQWQALAFTEVATERALAPGTAGRVEVVKRAQRRADPYAAYLAQLPPDPCRVTCDGGCNEVWDLDECVIVAGPLVLCPNCRDVRTDAGWEVEEWFEEGDEE